MSEPKPRLLDVGNCDPDHVAIRRLVAQFDAQVDRVMHVHEALAELAERSYDLVLVNRLIFADSSDALPLIERMQADDRLRKIPVMMISNYADAQQRAVAAGAQQGFGKTDLRSPRTIEQLAHFLSRVEG